MSKRVSLSYPRLAYPSELDTKGHRAQTPHASKPSKSPYMSCMFFTLANSQQCDMLSFHPPSWIFPKLSLLVLQSAKTSSNWNIGLSKIYKGLCSKNAQCHHMPRHKMIHEYIRISGFIILVIQVISMLPHIQT